MNCPIESGVPEILLDYCAGRLDATESRQCQEHIAVCADCREIATVQAAVWSAMDSWTEEPVSTDFNRRLYARIDSEEARHGAAMRWIRSIAARWSPFSWRPVLPVATACVLLVGAVFVETPEWHGRTTSSSSQAVVAESKPDKVDVEQVERALDDLDMLRTLGAVSDHTSRPAI